ncbi:MAG: PepSY domain-containing protein [Pseudomonadales bacterium]|jgi:uncharacterized membrane protein YkoI|nr:PepSY domain-containing protein [Pseudomonadales bacterium]
MAPVHRSFACLVAALLWCLAIPVTTADDGDHDRARLAFEAGEIMPLRTIIDSVESAYSGQIVEVELDRDDGLWIYEIELLRSSGALVKIKLDATEGTLLGIKGRDIERTTQPERIH